MWDCGQKEGTWRGWPQRAAGGDMGQGWPPRQKPVGFPPRLEAEGRSRTHSGIRSFLKQQMTSPTFGIMFHWFQFHDKEIDMKEAE